MGKRNLSEAQESLPGIESPVNKAIEAAAHRYNELREEATRAGAERNGARARLVSLMEEAGFEDGYRRGPVCVFYERTSKVVVRIGAGEKGGEGE